MHRNLTPSAGLQLDLAIDPSASRSQIVSLEIDEGAVDLDR